MTRILADLPKADIEKLDALAEKSKLSRAALLRQAVAQYLAQKEGDRSWIDKGYGLWADRNDIPDGLEYQRSMREDLSAYEDI